jgi:hypothetical protein
MTHADTKITTHIGYPPHATMPHKVVKMGPIDRAT